MRYLFEGWMDGCTWLHQFHLMGGQNLDDSPFGFYIVLGAQSGEIIAIPYFFHGNGAFHWMSCRI